MLSVIGGFLLLAKTCQKWKLKKIKLKDEAILEGFHFQKWEKIYKNVPDTNIWFSMCSHKYKKADNKFLFNIYSIARSG